MSDMEYTGYLFVHFIGEQKDGEQIYFSLSRDGLHWQDLNGGEPVLKSGIGEKGARDPFLIRIPKGTVLGESASQAQKYYLIATDLRIEAGKGWHAAQYAGSRDILVWESENLTDWSGPVAHTIGVGGAIGGGNAGDEGAALCGEGAGCVWAPEAVYDQDRKAILLFWASMVKLSGDREPKQRIYASYTEDFRQFTPPFLFMERENHVIDSTVIRVEEGYYRYTKDETAKNICVDFSEDLNPEHFRPVASRTLSSLFGVEGPEIFKLNNREEYCLIVDRFATHGGYLPLLAPDLRSGEFRVLSEEEFDMGGTVKRHGGILNLTEEEYQALIEKYQK